MALIDSLVDITITRNTLGVSKTEFSTILIIGDQSDDPAVKEYTSLAEVLGDYPTNTTEYAMALAIFSQDITVKKILITQTGASETYLQAYNRVLLTNDFYAVIVGAKDDPDLTSLANAIEASKASGQSPKILSAVEQDLVGLGFMISTHGLSLTRTNVIYKTPGVASEQTYANAAWLGLMLPQDPGTATFAYKTLRGMNAATSTNGALTSAKIAAIEANNGNYYTRVAGRDSTFNGKMASGEYIDIIYAVDWLENTMQQDVANVYFTNPKIPYTNQGIGLIETAMRISLDLAKSRGVILDYKITTPDITTISFSDKSTRTLNGVTFEATLTGAIHKTTIKGYVTL